MTILSSACWAHMSALETGFISLHVGAIVQPVQLLGCGTSGQNVLEIKVAANSGAAALPLDGLPEGIYVCRIQVGDTVPTTRKLVIRH